MPNASLTVNGKTLLLRGDLNFSTVVPLEREGKTLLQSRQIETIDLGNVEQANSAALALLLVWQGFARRHDVNLHFKNWPSALKQMANLSDLDDVLNIQ